MGLAWSLPPYDAGNGVIRATTLFIVLTLAGTPTATSACIGWCGAHEWTGGTATSCHPRTTTHGSPSLVAETHECDSLLQYMPFVREDLQQVASGSASNHAVVMVCACLGRQRLDNGPSTAAWDHLVPRSHSIALRI